MDLLNIVKIRLGIFFSNEIIDADIQSMITECKEFLINGGATKEQVEASSLTISACSLWCKMSRNSNADTITNHPVLTNYVVQIRTTEVGGIL